MFFNSIRKKLFFIISFLVLLISFCFLFIFTYQINNLTKENLINFGFHLAHDLSSGSEMGIASEDPVLFKSVFERIFEEKEVILTTVYNKRGQIIASKKKVDIEERITGEMVETLQEEKKGIKKTNFTQAGKEVFDFYSPVLAKEQTFLFFEKPGELMGFVRVVLSLESTKDKSRQLMLSGLFVTILMIFLGTLISFIFSEKITKPFNFLIEETKNIANGNLGHQIKIKTGDEIEELADAFNQTTKKLEKSHTALEEAKTVLEIKVNARTKELKELNENLDKRVKEKTKELTEKIEELERFQKLTIGRELKMIELKEEIKKHDEELEKRKKRKS